jgi:hypothetical protein
MLDRHKLGGLLSPRNKMPIYNVTDPTTGKSLKLTGDSAPTEQELSQIFAAQPPQQAENPIDRIFRQGEERRKKAAAEAASAPSMLGSFARGARESIGAGLGSAAGMAAGIALAPETGGLSMLIPLVGGLAGGAVGGMGQGMVDPMTAEREKALQRDMATNPVSSWVGSVAPMVATMKPNISGIGTALRSMEGAATAAERAAISGSRINMAAGAGIGGGLSLGMNALHGQLPTPGGFAGDVLLGAAFNEPNRLGRALGMHSSARPVMPGEAAPAVMAQIEPGATPVPIEAAAPVPARPGYLGPEAPTGPIVMPPVVEAPTVGFQGVKGPNPASIFNPSEPVMPGVQAPENMAKPKGRQYQLKPKEDSSMPASTKAPPVQTGTGEPLSPRDAALAQINSEYQVAVDKANSIESLVNRGKAIRTAEMFRNGKIDNLNKNFPATAEAPPVAGEAPPVPATSAEPIVSAPAETPKFTLPKELSRSSPRYGFKDSNFTLTFESDLDRAAYILANDSIGGKKSKSADKFRKVITDAGLDEAAVIEYGKKVRGELKAKAETARSYQEDSIYMPDQGFKTPSAAKPVAVEPIVTNESQANAKGQTNDQGQANAQGQGETLLTPPEPPPVTGEAAPLSAAPKEPAPAPAPKPMSLEERINAIPEVEPKLPENATDFEKNLHNAMWAKERGLAKGAPLDPSKIAEIRSKSESPQKVKNFNNKSLLEPQEGGDAFALQQEQTFDGAAVTQAAEQAKANEALNNSLQRNIDFDKPVEPGLIQSAIDAIDGQINAAQDYQKSNKGRVSSMPIDIIGAQAYEAVLQVLKASLKAGQSINKAIASAMATIKNTKITNEERKIIERELRADATKAMELAKGRDADIKVQIGLAAEAMKDATGIAGNRLGIMREVTKKFPDQADYIKKNLNRIMDEMVAQEDLISKSKSPSSKEWGAWGRERVAQLNEIYGDAKSGLSAAKSAKVARAIHDHIFTNMGKRAHDIADGMITGKTSKAGKAYADEHFLLRPGADGVNRVGADILQETDSTKLLNKLGRHLQDLESSPDFVSIADAKKSGFLERVIEHVVDPSRDGELAKNPTLKKSVEFFSGIRGEIFDYARKNNIEIGDLGPRSMRRAMDSTKVFTNREAFLKDAVKTYEAKFGAELRILAEKAKKAGPGSKEQKAFLKRTAEINAMDMNDLASRYLAGIEAGDLGITTDGNDFYLGEGGLTPNMFKAREFGPEAEVFLRKYMINNPFKMIQGEVVALTRAVTKARLLGGMGKDGKFDSLGGWKKLRAELEAEGNLDMVPLYQQIIKNYLNVRGADSQAAQSLLQGIHGLTQLTYLARAAVSSLPEPTMIGVRAGSLREAARANMVTASNFVKLVRRAKPSENLIVAEALGEIKIGQHAMMGSESINNAFSGRGLFGNLVSKFYEKTFLTDWTNATMAASMDIGKTFINMNLKLIKENGALSRLSLQSLREIGIGREDLPMMQEFAARFEKEPNWSKLIIEDSPAAAKFRDALTLFKRTGGALDPTRASKTVASTNPITSLFYSLSGYLYEFHDKITRRAFVRGKAAITGKMMIEGKMEPLTGTERAALLGEIAKGAVALYSTQYAVQLIRENLYADPERIAKDKRRTPGQVARLRAAAALSRSSVFGPYDSIFNAITQARYQRDPATTLLGPEIGGISDLFGQTANMIRGERNAPGTNTAERKLARTVYNMTVAPAVGAFAATMPGYAVPTTLINFGYSPSVRERFVETVAGKRPPAN